MAVLKVCLRTVDVSTMRIPRLFTVIVILVLFAAGCSSGESVATESIETDQRTAIPTSNSDEELPPNTIAPTTTAVDRTSTTTALPASTTGERRISMKDEEFCATWRLVETETGQSVPALLEEMIASNPQEITDDVAEFVAGHIEVRTLVDDPNNEFATFDDLLAAVSPATQVHMRSWVAWHTQQSQPNDATSNVLRWIGGNCLSTWHEAAVFKATIEPVEEAGSLPSVFARPLEEGVSSGACLMGDLKDEMEILWSQGERSVLLSDSSGTYRVSYQPSVVRFDPDQTMTEPPAGTFMELACKVDSYS